MHRNEELLRREYDAFAGNDLDALVRIFSDDVVYHLPGAARSPETIEGGRRSSVSST
jgi:ketosteroid isomerase-like protein